jgi:Holliday junction resolvase-like predicted endonuclease
MNGQKAETEAASYLNLHGFRVIDRNWRTKWCEIDIVAQKDGITYFFEVKYRKRTVDSAGLDYINSNKLKQMKFAAELWVSHNNWAGDYELSAIEIAGPEFVITEFIDQLT